MRKTDIRAKLTVNHNEFKKLFDEDIFDIYGKSLEKYIKAGFLINENGRIKFADKAFFVSNTILSDFV